MIVYIKFLFDFLVPENLDSTLLDVQIISPKCSFFRLAQWFDLTNFITEKQNSQQYVVLYTEISWTGLLYSGYLLSGRGVTRGTKEAQFTGRRITVGGAAKSQQYHKYIIQDSTLASERPQVQTWGRQTCFLPRAPPNLVALLLSGTCCQKLTVEWHW